MEFIREVFPLPLYSNRDKGVCLIYEFNQRIWMDTYIKIFTTPPKNSLIDYSDYIIYGSPNSIIQSGLRISFLI